MAFFLRTRRLDLRRLERKPQESLDVVRAILTAAVRDVLDKLHRLERVFYGSGKSSAFEEIMKWAGPVKNVMAAVHLGQITCAWQIDEIIRRTSDDSSNFDVDVFELNKMKECYRKIKDTVPAKFGAIVKDAKQILTYLEKYCLSFYDPEEDVSFETAEHYEKDRQAFINLIGAMIESINDIAEKFSTRGKGVHGSDLNDYGMDLARRASCASIAFLVMFPMCCENIRTACSAMTSWIQSDEGYSDFIKNDVTDLEAKRSESTKIVRDLQQRFHQLSFKLKQVETECAKLEEDIDKLGEREGALMIEEEERVAETNDNQVEIEILEYRRDELIKNAADIHPQILYERYGEISESLRDLKRRLPFAKRELFAIRHKLEWIGSKQTELRQLTKKRSVMTKEMGDIDQQKQEHEIEHEEVIRCLELTRRILMYKNSPDTIEKIFHERPVEVNKARLPGQRGSEDPFERTCCVTALHIENDWPKLYRALPFHPRRGNKTIDRDIQEITSSRLAPEELAIKCIHRWRRFHTRAKQEDINEALSQIKRHDVLNKVDLELNPPTEGDEVEEEPITYVEEYLVPFVRQVERFDQLEMQLRAANKI